MASLKLIGISFQKAIELIDNVKIMILVSLAGSVAYDFHNFGTKSNISLDAQATVISAHFLGFFIWLVDTAITEVYSVYLFLGVSILTFIFLMFSDSDAPVKKVQKSEKTVLGVSYPILECLIYWLSFFTFIPTVLAFLVDFLFFIQYFHISIPLYSQMIVSLNYTVMIGYQYFRYIFHLFPNLEGTSSKHYLCEVSQLVAFSFVFFNPWRPTDKNIFKYFEYTTRAQKLAIPLLFVSLVFNCLIYFLIGCDSTNEKTSKSEASKVGETKEKNRRQKRRHNKNRT
ncbi:Protein CBG25384 [Caenorhabditis briggsae]|uniref:Protein CBG25384 n=1 Tax=Caenorhabditis briggsae TaxID=6238 RepID=B6IIP8_CAEBR|nr:Protein CBG25384 [Caenorhabditis briggsae]CAR99778.1 Protein CBG25384 [Caenorhabditis briggsae]